MQHMVSQCCVGLLTGGEQPSASLLPLYRAACMILPEGDDHPLRYPSRVTDPIESSFAAGQWRNGKLSIDH